MSTNRLSNAFQLAVFLNLILASATQVPGSETIEARDTSETKYGARIDEEGWVHFVVFSPRAQQVNLLLFENEADKIPKHVIPMTKHGADRRIKIKGTAIGPGLLYMFQATGPNQISTGNQFGAMFNEHFFLNDPYAYKTQNVRFSSFFSAVPHVGTAQSVYAGGGKSMVHNHSKDIDPGHVTVKREDLIIYELHVQDYTARIQSLNPKLQGTYLGLAQAGLTTPGGLAAGLDHLVELGVTAVELMPVMEFDDETGNVPGRLNHWGYMTTNFFAPEARYASVASNQVIELKQLIKALHDRNIAVFLDVVYNHTGEQSPWVDNDQLAAKYYNFMGLCNTEFYKSTPDGRFFLNNTGTGNDVNFVSTNDGDVPFPKKLVTDSLAFWHDEYGVDGFRFDLARILADGSHNAADWPDNDSRFESAHLHAEPWDLAGQWYDFMDNYGWNYTNNRWAKWIGKYRDKIRKFSKSDLRNRTAFKQLIEGYGSVSDTTGGAASTKPWRSVNFLAVHDGYTLRDCVFFNDDDGSHNCWDSGGDENLRRERQKQLMGVLLTSQGVPLILQGDEFGRTKSHARTQAEAHNTYNYESSTGDTDIDHVSWIDWKLKDGDNSDSPNGPEYGRELFHWTKHLIQLRKKWTHFRRTDFPEYVDQAANGGSNSGQGNDGKFTYSWEGPGDGAPSQLAVIWWGRPAEPDVMVVYNENHQPFRVTNLADWSQGDWKILARSWFGEGLDSCDLDNWETECEDASDSILIEGRSMAILISDND